MFHWRLFELTLSDMEAHVLHIQNSLESKLILHNILSDCHTMSNAISNYSLPTVRAVLTVEANILRLYCALRMARKVIMCFNYHMKSNSG